MRPTLGPPTVTASGLLPDGRLAVMVGLRRTALDELRDQSTALLSVPHPQRPEERILLMIRLTDADDETFMALARAAFAALAVGKIQPPEPLQILPYPADTPP